MGLVNWGNVTSIRIANMVYDGLGDASSVINFLMNICRQGFKGEVYFVLMPGYFGSMSQSLLGFLGLSPDTGAFQLSDTLCPNNPHAMVFEPWDVSTALPVEVALVTPPQNIYTNFKADVAIGVHGMRAQTVGWVRWAGSGMAQALPGGLDVLTARWQEELVQAVWRRIEGYPAPNDRNSLAGSEGYAPGIAGIVRHVLTSSASVLIGYGPTPASPPNEVFPERMLANLVAAHVCGHPNNGTLSVVTSRLSEDQRAWMVLRIAELVGRCNGFHVVMNFVTTLASLKAQLEVGVQHTLIYLRHIPNALYHLLLRKSQVSASEGGGHQKTYVTLSDPAANNCFLPCASERTPMPNNTLAPLRRLGQYCASIGKGEKLVGRKYRRVEVDVTPDLGAKEMREFANSLNNCTATNSFGNYNQPPDRPLTHAVEKQVLNHKCLQDPSLCVTPAFKNLLGTPMLVSYGMGFIGGMLQQFKHGRTISALLSLALHIPGLLIIPSELNNAAELLVGFGVLCRVFVFLSVCVSTDICASEKERSTVAEKYFLAFSTSAFYLPRVVYLLYNVEEIPYELLKFAVLSAASLLGAKLGGICAIKGQRVYANCRDRLFGKAKREAPSPHYDSLNCQC